jgi:hypothetical protein
MIEKKARAVEATKAWRHGRTLFWASGSQAGAAGFSCSTSSHHLSSMPKAFAMRQLSDNPRTPIAIA